MPTPVAVLSGGTRGFELGIFKNGSVAQGFNFPLSSNYRWWNGVEVLATQYLIYTDKYTMGSSNLADTIPVAWATPDLTDQSLINLINTLPPRVGLPGFTSLQPALDWLQGTNDFYLVKNGLENIVTTNLQLYYDSGLYNSYVGTGTSVIDLSGNNRTGTLINGTGFISSGVGTFDFDGSDDYITSSLATNATNNVTIDAWFNSDNVSQAGQMIVYNGSDNGGNGFGVSINYEGSTSGNIYVLYGALSWFDTGIPVSSGIWYHVAMTISGTSLKVYLNGLQVYTTTASNPNQPTLYTNVGRNDYSAARYFNGKIPIARVYTSALTAQQILQNYNAQKGRFGLPTLFTDGLVVQLEAGNPSSYPGTGTVWYDISGNGNNFTLFNGASYDSTTKSMAFDGSDDYARSTNFIDLSSASATTVQWIGKQDTASQQFLWEHTPDWNSTPGGFGILMDSTGNGFQQGSWHANWYNQSARNFINLIQSTSNFFSQTHRLIPNNSLGLQDWVNTDLQTFVVGPGYPTGTSTVGNNNGFANNYTYLASRAGSSLLLDGNIGVFLMYNRALSQPEIVQNYEYYRSLYGLTGVTRNGLVLWLDAGNNQSYPTQGTTWYDISGSVFDGRLLNGPTYSTDGGGSILFEGTNDIGEISLGNIPTGTQARTISVWVKYVAYGSDYYSICGYGDESSSRTFDIGIINSTQRIFLDVYGAGGIQTTNSVTPGTWFNVTGIYTGTQLKLYLNGSLETTNTFTINTASSTFKIADMAWSYPGLLNGNVGNVIFYNRALSDSEVTQNFNAQKNRYGL